MIKMTPILFRKNEAYKTDRHWCWLCNDFAKGEKIKIQVSTYPVLGSTKLILSNFRFVVIKNVKHLIYGNLYNFLETFGTKKLYYRIINC